MIFSSTYNLRHRSQQKTLPSEKEYQPINPANKTYVIRHGEDTYEITQSEKGPLMPPTLS